MIRKVSIYISVIVVILFYACDPGTQPDTDPGTQDPQSVDEAYSVQLTSDPYITLVIDEIDSEGKSRAGNLLSYDGGSGFHQVYLVDQTGTVIDSSWKAISLTLISPDYSIIAFTGINADLAVELYLYRLSTSEMYYLNPVLGNTVDSFCISENISIGQRDSQIQSYFQMDASNNLYTNAVGDMGNQKVAKISIENGTERISSEILTADTISVDQFAVNDNGDIIFGYNGNTQFAYRTASGSIGTLTPPANNNFVRVFAGSDKQTWIVSEENSGLGPRLFRIDFSGTPPSMIETGGISSNAVFSLPSRLRRDSLQTTFYSNNGLTTVSSTGTVNTVSVGTQLSSKYDGVFCKNNEYLFTAADTDSSSYGIVCIGDISQETNSWIGLNGDQYDIVQMYDMKAIAGSVFISVKQVLSGDLFLYELQSSGSLINMTSLTQKQRIISEITLP